MSVSAIKVTLGSDGGDGKFNSTVSYPADPVANLAAALAAYDTAAASIIAITGDTYSTVTKQFTFGGATGLTHAQWATQGALLNAAIAPVVAANAAETGNLTLLIDNAVITTSNGIKWAIKQALQAAANLGIVIP